MRKIKELKEICKQQAAYIRAARYASREAQRTGDPYKGPLGKGLWAAVPEYRQHHIAYCMLRGTPYERIEPKVHPGNEPCWEKIKKITDTYTEPEVPSEQTLCAVQA